MLTDEVVVADLLKTLNSKLDAYDVLLSKHRYLAGDVSLCLETIAGGSQNTRF